MPSNPDTEKHFACPVELTIAMIGGKWKPLLLWELRDGPRRFNALQSAMPGITHKVLAQQLRGLERDGFVTRTEHAGEVRHVEYELSGFGGTLRPVLNAMADWAKRHHARVGATLAAPGG